MNTCPHCHIRVGGDTAYCPLCQNRLSGPAGEPYFPATAPRIHRASLLYKIVAFVLSALIVVAGAFDFLLMEDTPHRHFSILMAVWAVAVLRVVRAVLRRRFNGPRQIFNLLLLVSALLIPIAAYAMGSLFFGSNPNLVCGIVLEYSVPVAVTAFMWISMFGGNGPLALTIILTSSVISPVTIPLTLKLLLGATVSIDVPSMMQNMAFMIAIPAVLGIVINELTRGWGHEKLSPALSPACKFMMMGVIASNSTAMSEYMLHMNVERLEVALFILVFAINGFVVGFLVARALHLPYSETTTMCFTCGMRNISSGAVIATQYFPGEVVFPVMCGTLFQQVLASIIGHLFERLTGEERAKQRKRVEAGRDAMAR